MVKIKKITEKTYWRLKLPGGKVVFLPPHKSDVPFKRIVTFDDNGKPFMEHYYMSDGRFYTKTKLPDTSFRVNYHITETRFNENGLIKFKKLEYNGPVDEECSIPLQKRFYFYDSSKRLSRKEIITTLNHHTVDRYGNRYLHPGETITIIHQLRYNSSGDLIFQHLRPEWQCHI